MDEGRSIDTIEDVAAALGTRGYVCDRALATATFLALRLERPLLLEGEAGVGKTELARSLAEALGAPLIRLQCYEGLDVSTAVYEWNYPRQMLEIRLLEARGKGKKANASDIFSPEFLIRRPLLQALDAAADGEPPLLLIDEIDRADAEFEAYLLELLQRLRDHDSRDRDGPRGAAAAGSPHQQPDPRGPRRPQAPLPVPLDRLPRCGPRAAIVHARLPEVPEKLARQVVAFIGRLRSADLAKVPGVAETLDWAAALMALGATSLDPEVVDDTLGVVLKVEEDVRMVRGSTARGYLDEVATVHG